MFDFIYKISNTPLQIVCLIGILAIGVFFLVKFCDIFVDSASAIAKKMKISPLVIGLTIVAMGTSCPELAVSVSDSISVLLSGGNANVALGNVVGSNICNLLLVLGLSAIFTPLYVKKSVCKREFPFLIGVSVLLTVFGIFFGLGDKGAFAITRWEAIIFVVLMVAYMVMIVKFAKKDQAAELANADLSTQGTQNSSDALKTEADEASAKEKPLWLVIVLCVLGIAGIITGGEMVVCGAKGLAVQGAGAIGLDHDLTEALVGLTIVAVGTSLPELVTSVIAASTGRNDIAMEPEVYAATMALRDFMMENVYTNPVAKREEKRAMDLLRKLYEYFVKHPEAMPAEYLRDGADSTERRVCDYISGMTDRYAIKLFEDLFVPKEWNAN